MAIPGGYPISESIVTTFHRHTVHRKIAVEFGDSESVFKLGRTEESGKVTLFR